MKIKPLRYLKRMMLSWEEKGHVERTPAFLHDYKDNYPEFLILEENYEMIRQECEALLSRKEDIVDMNGLMGKRTTGGIHAVKWKTFFFKTNKFIKENCEICPKTAALLKQIPGIRSSFFSILDANQYIKPHKGSYHGFLRYHLGVIIPYNNESDQCWIRINENKEDNERYDKESMHRGETYHWKNGEGIMFNDNYLHEAKNDSDKIRVVLFIDVVRKYPTIFSLINRAFISIGFQSKQLKQLSKNARIKPNTQPTESN